MILLFFVIYIVISNSSARLDLCKSAFRHFNTEHNVDNHNLDTSPQTPSYIEVYDKNGATTKCWGISRYLNLDFNDWRWPNLIINILRAYIVQLCN